MASMVWSRRGKFEVVDTTAAGDTFVGAYALEIVKRGFSINTAVRTANAAAERRLGRGEHKSRFPGRMSWKVSEC